MLAVGSLVLLTLALAMPVSGNHPQAAHGDVLVFDHRTGNEWWVEVVLAGGSPGSVARVEAMDSGGPWVELTKRSWGAWAASFHIEPGNDVKFRAWWTGGDGASSCWFSHPSGVEDCGETPPPPPPPPPGSFDATWSQVKGNEWWVEARVTASAPIDAVSLAIDCDTGKEPRSMVFRPDWGKWVLGGVRIPAGAKVTMEAHGGDGSDRSGGYVWPQATPTAGCDAAPPPPPPSFAPTFRNPRGNDWWVEVEVLSDRALAGVDARVDCSGAWVPLAKRSWGTWAASFHVVSGSLVDFRARAADGAVGVSPRAYVWPQAAPVAGCGPDWPQEGSSAQVRFRGEERWDDVDGAHLVTTDGLLTVSYEGGAWDGSCEVVRKHRDGSGRWTNVTETWPWEASPPRGEVGFRSAQADVSAVENCASVLYPDQPVVGRETRAFSVRTSSGDPVPIDAYHARSTGPTHDNEFWWDARHGLMLSWTLDSSGGSNSYQQTGWLLDTDAY